MWVLGCGGAKTAPVTPVVTPPTYTVVAISDIHFNPLANPTLFPQLVAQPASQWQSIFAANQSANPVPPATFGADANYSSLVLALAALKQNLGSSPVVLLSGDMLGHDLSQCFYQLYSASTVPAQLNRQNVRSVQQRPQLKRPRCKIFWTRRSPSYPCGSEPTWETYP